MTMKLTGPKFKQLRDAILAAYSKENLRELLLFHLEKRIDDISTKSSFRDIVFEIIDTAQRERWLLEFIKFAHIEREADTELYSIYKEFWSESSDTPPLFTRTDKRDAKLKDWLCELAEWKLIHNDSQALVDALDVPIALLTICRLKPENANLDYAGDRWQESCAPKLKDLPDKWNLKHVDSPIFDELRERTLDIDIDNISRRLMQIDVIEEEEEFEHLYLQLREIKGTVWQVLTIADKGILVLVETMQRMIEV